MRSYRQVAGTGRYLTATDLGGQAHTRTIMRIEEDEFEKETKKGDKYNATQPVIYFGAAGTEGKGVVINATRGDVLVAAFGDDMDSWIGQVVQLSPGRTRFGNDIVDCIDITCPGAAPMQQQAPLGQPDLQQGGAPVAPNPPPVPQDDIPF